MYILSVKSFISRVRGAAVIAHSDGSLSSTNIDLLKYHIPGIRVVTREDADNRAKVELSSFLQEVRRYGGTFDRLIDAILWSESSRHIQMDSDVLTIDDPDFIKDWFKKKSSPFVIADYQKQRQIITADQYESAHIQTQMEHRQNEIAEMTGLDFGDTIGMCSGLYGWSDQLRLDDIETFVRACNVLGFDMTKWGAEQVTTTWLLSARGGKRLPADKYINLQPPVFHLIDTAVMIHFIGDNRFRNNWYAQKAAKEIKRLMVWS